jgi:hypothetical protein
MTTIQNTDLAIPLPSNRHTVVSKSVANPWRDPKIAVLAGPKAVKKWIR